MNNLGPPVGDRTSTPRAAACRRANPHRLVIVLMTVALPSLSLRPVQATGASTPTAAPDVSVTDAWARATPPGTSMGAAYLTITNRSRSPEVLLGASSPLASGVQIHRTMLEGGVSRMRPAGEITIAPGASVRIEPGGLHLMLVGLDGPLVEGHSLPLTLLFRNAGSITVQVAIRPLVDVPAHGGH